MKTGALFIVSGPSGSGKTTLCKKLLADPSFKLKIRESVSATTRQPRPGEKNGREYFFISEKMFAYKKKAGHFLEWEKVFDHFYGTLQKNVRDILAEGKSVLLSIDVKGSRTVTGKFPEACTIFIMPPSLAVLKERLGGRQTESPDALRLRLSKARQEIQQAKEYQFIIVNDNLDQAYKDLQQVVLSRLSL